MSRRETVLFQQALLAARGDAMRLILNGVNGQYLREITDNAAKEVEFVEAAVAYATDSSLLFDWCWNNGIPLRFWGRFDAGVPVSLHILRAFLSRGSPNFVCKLIRSFHAKVIWWHGVGAYVGSANLTDPAWYNNIEAGCFFDEPELVATAMDIQLRSFFRRVDEYSSPLTDELYKAIEQRAKELRRLDEQDAEQRKRFLATTSMRPFEGLLRASAKSAADRQKQDFRVEWFDTLQILRDIGAQVSQDENRPTWIPPDVPSGAQADQFLHAHYYNRVIGHDRRTQFAEMFETNRANPGKALREALDWWRSQPTPPSREDRMLFEWAPVLRDALSRDRLMSLSVADFDAVCQRVWSIQDHARRVANATLGLPGGVPYDIPTKTSELSKFLMSRRSGNGSTVLDVINFVLYGGSDDDLPDRLWDATTDPAWRIEHFGISAIGELIGWALPERFPPRNNRTSRSLRSLGFDVGVQN